MPTGTGHTTAIRASKVIGADVLSASGDRIGKVEDVVLDKTTNDIMFAIVGFGGFLGMNEKFHPMPWSMLNYSNDAGGYIVSATREQLERAPADSMEELTRNDGHGLREQAHTYYKQPRYWQ